MSRLSLVAALLLSTALAYGQTALATVTGTISDATGAVVANAPVSLKNLENGQVYTAASSATGNFSVSQLSIGDYDLTVKSPGFKTYTHSKFHLAAGQTMREDIALEVGSAAESVTVSAESSLLKTENSELAQNVTLSQLNNLPILAVGATTAGFRDPFAAVRLVPGSPLRQRLQRWRRHPRRCHHHGGQRNAGEHLPDPSGRHHDEPHRAALNWRSDGDATVRRLD